MTDADREQMARAAQALRDSAGRAGVTPSEFARAYNDLTPEQIKEAMGKKAQRPVFTPLSFEQANLDAETLLIAKAAIEEAGAQEQAAIDYENGHVRAREGAERFDNPYPTGKPGHADWDRGWCDGQTRAAGEQPTPPECPNVARLFQLISGGIGLMNNSEAQKTVLRWWNAVRPELEKSVAPCSPCPTCAELKRERLHLALANEALTLERNALHDKAAAQAEALKAIAYQVCYWKSTREGRGTI